MTSTTPGAPLIALISATPAAIGPARQAFAAEFPEAELLNLLDDGLQEQANRAGGLTDHLTARMRRLIDHAVLEGADGVLLTCSMYSSVAQTAAPDLPVPVLGPDDAAFTAVIDGGYHSVLVIASQQAALADAQARLTTAATDRGSSVTITGVVADGAFAAVQASDTDTLFASLKTAVHADADFDAVLLAQYSLTPVAGRLEAHLDRPVLSGPTLAATLLRDTITKGV